MQFLPTAIFFSRYPVSNSDILLCFQSSTSNLTQLSGKYGRKEHSGERGGGGGGGVGGVAIINC